jgi:hypothetical protein
MQLTPEQLHVVQEALESSCDALLEEFEQNKFSRDMEKRKIAVKAYGKLRRQSRLLTDIRKTAQPIHDTSKNNVLLLIANRR